MTELKALDLYRRILADTDGYMAAVESHCSVVTKEYSRLIDKGYPHKWAAHICNEMIAEIEEKNNIKLMMSFE